MQETQFVSGPPERSPRAVPERGSPHGAAARPLPLLAGVAAAFALVHLVLVAPGLGLGWDETVYVSQVSPQAPAAFFSAPRARGITYLVAPVAALTTSVAALRVYMAVLAGCGLFLALWVWRRLLPAPVLALAGALFASLWVTMFYASQAMPNLWVAYGALAAVGCFLRAARDPGDGRALIGMGAGVAFAALMRPTDAVWLTLALVVAALAMPRTRRRGLLVLVAAAGVTVGCAEWVIEAYVHYGGLAARLRRASEIQGHLGWYFSVDDHVRALGGRALCRPCDVPWRYPASALWFLALPLFVAGGVLSAVRARSRTPILLATAVGAALAAPYLFTVGYAAPRFLLPAYALLALPVAQCLLWLCLSPLRWRRTTVGLVVVAVVAHLAIQYALVVGVANRVRRDTVDLTRIAAELRAQGVRPPCVISGEEAIRVAFRTGCASRQPGGHDGSITPQALAATALEQPVAVLVSGNGRPPAYAREWRVHPLPDLGHRTGLRAYVSPGVSRSPTG
ncbi:ArnT family glycosyltransferase [Streptomyces sp. NPDC015346]|uniref:ArnT family glycosyltransferase n=1 Tax=Streptomyces sp. NPDC015346 TaxID=3364954 RepID=UPI003700BF53